MRESTIVVQAGDAFKRNAASRTQRAANQRGLGGSGAVLEKLNAGIGETAPAPRTREEEQPSDSAVVPLVLPIAAAGPVDTSTAPPEEPVAYAGPDIEGAGLTETQVIPVEFTVGDVIAELGEVASELRELGDQVEQDHGRSYKPVQGIRAQEKRVRAILPKV
jgi:hypothetical protein